MKCGHILTEDGRFLDTEDGRRLVTECFEPATTSRPGGVPRRSFVLERFEEDAVIAALLSEL